MNRHKDREKAMVSVYQNLVYPRDPEQLIDDNYSAEDIEKDPYMRKVIHTAIDNTEKYTSYINEVLDDWRFDRLGYIEQAILLCGCAEFDLKEVQAPIIIDEYVQLAKDYCDPDSYKLINGVLDRI